MSEIAVNDLNWRYGQEIVLDGVSFKVEKGKFYSILGPNGSGKTTMLKNILKILEPDKESIYIDNKDITVMSSQDMATRVACVPQETKIDFDFTVLDIVMMGRAPYLKRFEVEGKKDFEIAKEAMIMTNTWKFKDKSVKTLSGGERQRVVVARAIVQQTDILLLDEPISHLDIHHQLELLDTISYLCKEKQLTVISVLHDINMAAQYSDFLILLNEGKIRDLGVAEKVITEEAIEKVYKAKCCIIKNPITNKPHIIPMGKHGEETQYGKRVYSNLYR
ncbi:ABC transporter ATP-binding protein [Proteinivorax tanatarense]|uniref:ABC transporter ATP-binding protein n=1 Tax=Proteinivorax tanatarense TaxID=1260629 RepID=A0AAU7VIZ0_9FIRM